jgi:hypothetical protein
MNTQKIEKIEKRFKIVTDISCDLSVYPIKEDVQFDTDKEKSRDFAEVFTPLKIVDEMISIVPYIGIDTRSIDLCAGYGHFSVRMIRKLFNEYDNFFNLSNFLNYRHLFNELQISSCCKLLWIFGDHINLAIGDALQLAKLPKRARGIWYYFSEVDSWVDLTKIVKSIFKKSFWGSNFKIYNVELEKRFIGSLEAVINSCIRFIKEENVKREDVKKTFALLARTKDGREKAINLIRGYCGDWDDAWQNVETPEDIAKEMINTIPEIEQKKILVLFNIEFIELLIHWKCIDPANICYGFDSKLKGAAAKGIYKVEGIYIGKDLESFKAATVGIEGKYDVVLSNPPYQIQSEAQKNKGDTCDSQAIPIYNKIVEYTIDYLKPKYVCMITPSKWLAGGMGLKSYRSQMLNNDKIKVIVDFPGDKDIFKNVIIKGGVSYFLLDNDYNGLCDFNGVKRDLKEFDIFVRDNIQCQVIRKVVSKSKSFCENIVSSRKPFGIPSNYSDWSKKGSIKCYCKNMSINYVDKCLDKNNYVNKYKVCTSGAINLNKNGSFEVYNSLFIAEPNSVCTETYIVANAFDTMIEAENYIKYMKTRFYRFMLSSRIISQNVSKENFKWVPDMVDYNHTYTDADLYKHFELTKKEIEHIEKSIKEIK